MIRSHRVVVFAAAISAPVLLAIGCGDDDVASPSGPDATSSADAPAPIVEASSDAVDESPYDAVIDASDAGDACVDGGCDPVVFLTSKDYTGALGGLAGADQECTALANAAGIAGTFRAWLSTGDAGAPPSTRFARKSGQPYRLVDGRRVAADFAALTSLLEAPISVTEKGTDLGFSLVWTATKPDGTANASATDCAGWTSADGGDTGGTGESDDQNDEWTIYMNLACTTKARLYCFEQRP